jgi:hypothetical protein
MYRAAFFRPVSLHRPHNLNRSRGFSLPHTVQRVGSSLILGCFLRYLSLPRLFCSLHRVQSLYASGSLSLLHAVQRTSALLLRIFLLGIGFERKTSEIGV